MEDLLICKCGQKCALNWHLCPMCGQQLRVPVKRSNEENGTEFSSIPQQRGQGEEAVREFEQIDPRDVEWGEKLGEGSYGVVYRGKIRGTPVALKCVKTYEQLSKDSNPSVQKNEKEMRKKIDRQLEILKKEQNVCRQFYNPNICLYLGFTRDIRAGGNLVLVSELMETELNAYIANHKQPPSLYTCMSIAEKIATGMSWIEGSVIHTDLKPSNILLGNLDHNGHFTPKSTCKVCDFGLSVVSTLSNAVRGTPVYQSPESLHGQHCSSKTDVFSFGWICVNLALWKTERKLFRSIKTMDQLRKFANDEKSRLAFVKKYLEKAQTGDPVIDVVCACLKGKAEDRPTFKALTRTFQREVFVHAAIRVADSAAMRFWKKYFLPDGRQEVSFDEFLAAMTNEALMCGGGDSNFPLSRDKVHYLHLLFCADQQTSSVSLERFGRVCAVLGPFEVGAFVAKVTSIYKHRWFFGEMATTTAAFALSNEKAGTFLVRFANSRVSDFAISRVYPSEGYIHHMHVRHPPEQDCFQMACEDIDMSSMSPQQVAALRATYPSLVDLMAGVKEALDLREPLKNIPRLLIGQNVKHNGYFVRAFFSDSEDEEGNSHDELKESPVEMEEEGVITPLLSKDYRRAARILGVSGYDGVDQLHQKHSVSSARGSSLLLPLERFLGLLLRRNLQHCEGQQTTTTPRIAADVAAISYSLVKARARAFFRLLLLDMPSSKVYSPSAAQTCFGTRDCGGLLSALCYVQFGLASPRLVELVMQELRKWLSANANFVPPHSVPALSLEQLARPVGWDAYLAILGRGIEEASTSSDSSESLRSSLDEDLLRGLRFGDFFLLTAFAELYSTSIICVTDVPIAEDNGHLFNPANPTWGPCVYVVQCTKAEQSKRIAVVGVTCGGLSFNPLLPAVYHESLVKTFLNTANTE